MANVTTITLNYALIIVFLFPLNVDVSPCFHSTVLVPVYRVYTFCFHNTVISFCYRLHTFVCMVKLLLLVSVWIYGFILFLKCVISQELMRECSHMVYLVVSLLWYFYIMGHGVNVTIRKVAFSANSYGNCHYDISGDNTEKIWAHRFWKSQKRLKLGVRGEL